MIVKILSSAASFSGVRYNTDKIQNRKGELIHASGFSPLSALGEIKPSDYVNYLKMVSSLNKRVSKPQFHAVISCKGYEHGKVYLRELAISWMEKMGYKDNPYLVVFHSDTQNNHVHLVSTRVDKNGKKISATFEKVRAVRFINELIDPDIHLKVEADVKDALAFQYANLAQFRLILESRGYQLIEETDKLKIIKNAQALQELSIPSVLIKIKNNVVDEKRIRQLKAIFAKYSAVWDTNLVYEGNQNEKFSSVFTENLKKHFGIEIICHAKNGLPPYGYSIIDNSSKSVLKGSQVMGLKEISKGNHPNSPFKINDVPLSSNENFTPPIFGKQSGFMPGAGKDFSEVAAIDLADDIDDEAILGRNRQRKGMARTNTR